MSTLKDLQITLDKIAKEIPEKAMKVIEVEGLAFIKKNFRDQGFNDNSLERWKKRKTTDRKGRDLTRYRTNRVGTQGSLTKFGRENEGRAILTGHNTGGDKLRNSFRVKKNGLAVTFFTYKSYAERHNDGLDGIPPRPFIGKSTYLEKKIKTKLEKVFKNTITK